MKPSIKIGRSGKRGALLGQAGVHAVASQLALRGIACSFPNVDFGVDLILESGLRVQVKVANVTYPKTANYPDGAYCFNLRRKTGGYHGIADFFILWGINENRFFVVPTREKHQAHLWFGRRGGVNRSNNAALYDHVSAQRVAAMEDRWDLLDVNAAVEKTLELQERS